MNRQQLENRFASYPDVVTLPEFRQMLGGIGDSTARKLMRNNNVRHYCIRNANLHKDDENLLDKHRKRHKMSESPRYRFLRLLYHRAQ